MKFVEIDGSQGEGGGQILRTSVSLSSILNIPVRISQIRAGRREPGLKPQHLQAIVSASLVCGGTLFGAEVGSTQIEYVPGSPKNIVTNVDTHTAGSVVLISQTLVPISILCHKDLEVTIIGGTEVSNSPTIDYLVRVVIPVYRLLGVDVQVRLEKRGYYPKGGGKITVKSDGSKSRILPLNLLGQSSGNLEESDYNILSISRSLPDHVTYRQSQAAQATLKKSSLRMGKVESDKAGPSLSPGSSLLIYNVSKHAFIGSCALGERGKKAEAVGEEAAIGFLAEARNRPGVDSHLADMIVPILACIPGLSLFSTPRISNHLLTNLNVARQLTGCSFELVEMKDRGLWRVSISGLAEKSI